jgi:hypothetical protein
VTFIICNININVTIYSLLKVKILFYLEINKHSLKISSEKLIDFSTEALVVASMADDTKVKTHGNKKRIAFFCLNSSLKINKNLNFSKKSISYDCLMDHIIFAWDTFSTVKTKLTSRRKSYVVHIIFSNFFKILQIYISCPTNL